MRTWQNDRSAYFSYLYSIFHRGKKLVTRRKWTEEAQVAIWKKMWAEDFTCSSSGEALRLPFSLCITFVDEDEIGDGASWHACPCASASTAWAEESHSVLRWWKYLPSDVPVLQDCPNWTDNRCRCKQSNHRYSSPRLDVKKKEKLRNRG